MRLLYIASDGKLSWTDDIVGSQIPSYAILSHTWDGQEVAYKDLKNHRDMKDVDPKLKGGYQKLFFCAQQAKRDSLNYFWVDTCCIDKSNNTELSEAINSMFRWYQNAKRCYVYLSDVESNTLDSEGESAFKRSRWFTRGWTLQELLAPRSVEFFSKGGARLGDKTSLKCIICGVTGIPLDALAGSDLCKFDVAERFSWAEQRQTTREEDGAYCLLGIFSIYMSLIYGEGKDNAIKRLQKHIDEAAEGVASVSLSKAKCQEERLGKICTWLSTPDPSINYHKAHKQRQAKTGLWLLDSSRFTDWKDHAASRLWLYGIPGCGKTILTSTIIKHLLQHCTNNINTVVAYFYFDFNDVQKQDPGLMLCSLLCQLLQRSSTMSPGLDTLFFACKNGQQQPPIHVLLEVTLQLVQQFTHVYIVLDALDECLRRQELLDVLTTVAGWHLDNVHLLITSRRERDIESSLETYIKEEDTICLQRDIVDSDIQRYVQQRLSDDKTLVKWNRDAAVRQEIEDALMHGARGMFRWAVCQLDMLAKCRNRAMLRKSLATLPQTLDQTYDRILTNISDDDCRYAIRILQWLTFSARPLSVGEIAEVVAIDVARDPAFDRDEVLEDPLEALNICSSLVTITTNDGEGRQESAKRIIALSHYSVQEYLVSGRIKQGRAKKYSMQEAECHNTIAKGSLMYLAQLQQPLSTEILEASALAMYAAEFWSSHLRNTGDEAEGSLLAMSLMSTGKPTYLNWIQLCNPDNPWKDQKLREGLQEVASPLYYAALLDLSMLARLLLDNNADVNAQGGRYGNALQAASFKGHEVVVKMLLDNDADINAQGGYCGNALYAASFKGHEVIVKMLLDNNADINAQGGYYGNPIYAALFGNYEQVVKLLLEKTTNFKTLFALTAKLVQVAPLPALLAVSGESWILDKKVLSKMAFDTLKTQLRTWLAQLWSTEDPQSVPIKNALKFSVEILQQAVADERNSKPVEPGTHLGIYCAALVLWAITIATNNRAERSQENSGQQHQHQSLALPFLESTSQPSFLVHAHRQSALRSVYDATVLSHAQITVNTLAFLSDIWSGSHHNIDPALYQIGCVNLLNWVEFRLRGVPIKEQSSAADDRMAQPNAELGKLLRELRGTIQRLLRMGGDDWNKYI